MPSNLQTLFETNTLVIFFIVVVALLHFYFLILEMFFWTKPLGLKTFRMSQIKANDSRTLAANQGLYNGFLASGLLWSLVHSDPIFAKQLALFFSTCVLIAGIYGGYTVNKRIFLIQGVPALFTIILLFLT